MISPKVVKASNCLVAFLDMTLIYTQKIGKSYNKNDAIKTVLQFLRSCIASPNW